MAYPLGHEPYVFLPSSLKNCHTLQGNYSSNVPMTASVSKSKVLGSNPQQISLSSLAPQIYTLKIQVIDTLLSCNKIATNTSV